MRRLLTLVLLAFGVPGSASAQIPAFTSDDATLAFQLDSMRAVLARDAGIVAAPPARAGDEVLVFAAASLTDALQEIGRDFEARNHVFVRFSFGASSDLARQIRAGAPADVLFSADTIRMDELERAGRVRKDDRREFLGNSLVVVVATGSAFRMREPRDLLSLPRLALADPEAVPAGVYAKKWLVAEGLWNDLASRIVPTLDVRAALAAIETEAVPAGIVYKTDARVSKRVRIAWEVSGKPEILYSLARISGSRNKGAADFARYLQSGESTAIFVRYGFVIRADR
jgi:molybdate transport system substrate-binding protein